MIDYSFESQMSADTKGTFQGKVAIVTGAGSGIGRAIALLLAARGAAVAIVDLSPEGSVTLAEIHDAGGKALFLQGNVTDSEFVASVFTDTVRAFGGLDILCNNAGVLRLADSFELTTDKQYEETFDVNVKAVFEFSRAALPFLKSRGKGSIVNTASMVGYRLGMEGHAIYGASKAAVVGLSLTMALELAPFGIRVNCVAPGVVATSLYVDEFLKSHDRSELESGSDATLKAIPNGSYARPDQIAETVAFLASDAADYVTGQTILVDGGYATR